MLKVLLESEGGKIKISYLEISLNVRHNRLIAFRFTLHATKLQYNHIYSHLPSLLYSSVTSLCSLNSVSSSPSWNMVVMMSQPPTNSPLTYS